MDKPKLIPTWGYKTTNPSEGALFHLPEGEDLPDGYYDSPAHPVLTGKEPAPAPKKRRGRPPKAKPETNSIAAPSDDASIAGARSPLDTMGRSLPASED